MPKLFALPKNKELVLSLILIGIGFFINFFFGRFSFMPLDQSIVFDGGWRVLLGQKPFIDFFTPYGIIPYYIQSGFFRLLGINWFAYLAHASLFNGIFCVLCYSLLRYYSVPISFSFFYAALSSFVFYAPIGTPFIDHHAFFFGFLSLCLAVYSTAPNIKPSWQVIAVGLVPISWFLAYFSKQSPSIFFVPLIIFLIGTRLVKKRKSEVRLIILSLLISSALCIFAIYLFLNSSGIDFETFIYYFNTLPSKIGKNRIYSIATHPRESLDFLVLLFRPRFIAGTFSPGIPFSILICLFLCYKLFFSKKNPQKSPLFYDQVSIISLEKIWLILGLNFISIVFMRLTLNQPSIAVPFVFVSLGLIHSLLISFSQNFLLSNFISRMLIAATIVVAIYNLTLFGYYADWRRDANDLVYNHKIEVYKFSDTSNLRYLHWQTPSHYTTTGREFEALINYLKNQKDNFFIFGDSSVLYGLSGKPSVNPSILLVYGYGMPTQDEPNLKDFQYQVIRNLAKYKVRIFLEEGSKTFMGLKLSDFPILNDFISENKCHKQGWAYGEFKISKLCYK